MKLQVVILTLMVVAYGCGDERIPVIADPTVKESIAPKPALELIDISKVPPLDKSRFQEGHTATGEPNQVAKDLLANGKDSIPFLISKLEDETKMESPTVNFWYQMCVGDLALIILEDLFTDETEMNSTIPGFGWDDFLERGRDRALMGEEVLRRYIRKHGRKKIKERWQMMWQKNKDKIFWDGKCFCFKLHV